MSAREYRERLIDEVKKYPVLYDTRHDQHRDIDARDRCWAEIASTLSINGEVLKRDWKILRDSLRQALKNDRDLVVTKNGLPRKKWRFQARMAFLIPYMTIRPPRLRRGDSCKADAEAEHQERGEGGAGAAAGAEEEWLPAAAPAAGGEDGALELFFASVCASARRLPAPLQRDLKRGVLDTLLALEARAAAADSPPPDTKAAPPF